MAQGSQSIHQILEAEKEATKIVEKAREYRTQRLKEARSEAQKEINDHGAKAKADFEGYEKSGSGTSDVVVQTANRDTDAKEQQILRQYEMNKEQAIKVMVEAVWRVQPEVHRNVKV
eukprot:TRINITY_DN56639_c0_g1_i1.p1 TRINITY_DN56639_c0_g1~~TRINITY_DN56639_c0_g1_i1.p1  ORF type:complete len:117 (+),score=11.49 TRINITY_DN56639_c0_g1_i1:113-463(+)